MSVRFLEGEKRIISLEQYRVWVEEEEKVWLSGTYQTTVLDVQAIKDGCDAPLPIYGTISVSTQPTDPSSFSAIFDRHPNDPDYIVPQQNSFHSYLTLKEHDKHPPLTDVHRFGIQMKLYQKEEEDAAAAAETKIETTRTKKPSKASDAVIADTGLLTYTHWTHILNKAYTLELEGKEGFKFKVSCVGAYGCRVRVSLKLHMRSESPVSFYGTVAAQLSFSDRFGVVKGICCESSTRLLYRDCEEPLEDCEGPVAATGDSDSIPIPLDRSVMLAPIGFSHLTISFNLVCSTTSTTLAKVIDCVPFVFSRYYSYFATNRQRSHTKKAVGNLVSVNIDILNAGKEFDGGLDESD